MAQSPSIVLLNATTIQVDDEIFIQAYQEGYLRFKTNIFGNALSDKEVYHFIAQSIYDLRRQSTENAGYITGWFAALFENTSMSVSGI